MKNKSKKVIETEQWVDSFIAKYGHPPKYRDIELNFNLSKCAAWSRCAKFRNKMKQNFISKSEIRKTIYDLELHESLQFNDKNTYTFCTRVPGGWIYEFYNPDDRCPVITFVPYSAEFLP
jgi:hypothetical protein